MSSLSLRNELIKVLAFGYKNWIITKRNVFTLLELVFWPVIWLVSVGLMTHFLGLTQDVIAFILVGVISLSVVQVCQLDVAYVLLFDVWSKSIKHTFIAPIKGLHLVLGSWFVGMSRGSFVFLLLMGFAYKAFNFDFLKPGVPTLLLFLLGLFINAALIGMTVCVLVLIFGQRAEVAAWSLVSLMLLICGIYYPTSLLPQPFATLSRGIPLTYFLEYFRSFYGYEPGTTNVLAKAYLTSIVYFGLGLVALKTASERARVNGLLLKLSE